MQTIFGSHSAIAPYRLLRPARIEEAAAAMAGGAACLAGGVDLVPALRAGRRVERIVHLGGIAALKAIERRGDVLRIGAGVTYARLAADPAIAAALPDLAAVWRGVANVRVRHAATVGGNLMAGNPNYDMLPALLVLDAKLVFVLSNGGHESVRGDAKAWPQGLLACIDVPLAPARRFAFERGFKPAISLAVAVEGQRARIAIGCAYERAFFHAMALDGSAPEVLADAVARELPEPLTDWIASGTYRRRLARVLLARRLRALTGG
ncbi:MAG TPA: FAD binding domain-containing protein [Alphaproteobacteria bacterium]|jgi:CO/xanthine dehydrogenase FAD-binding subunit